MLVAKAQEETLPGATPSRGRDSLLISWLSEPTLLTPPRSTAFT